MKGTLGALVAKEFRQAWRAFRIPGFFLILMLFALTDPPVTKYMNQLISMFAKGIQIIAPPPTPQEAFLQFAQDAVQMGSLAAILMTMGSVAVEKANGVTGWMLTRPISRASYLGAKIIVLVVMIAAGVAASSAIAYLYTWSLLGMVDIRGALLVTAAVIAYILLLAAFTFAGSALLSSSAGAAGVGIGAMVVIALLRYPTQATRIAKYMPHSLTDKIPAAISMAPGAADVLYAVAAALVISAAVFWFAIARFKRLNY